MYRPNFILVGGIASVLNQEEKDYVANRQMAGDYSAIEDILMQQFSKLVEKETNSGKCHSCTK